MKFTEAEILFIKENYNLKSHKEIALILNRTKSSIRLKCFSLGLRKHRSKKIKDLSLIIDKLRLPIGESTHNHKYQSYRSMAIKRNYEFNLTKEEFKNLIIQDCYFCGKHPIEYNHYININTGILKFPRIRKEWAEKQTIKVNGVDRLDNSKGYVLNNCVPCCIICNKMKLDMSEKDFILHLKTILNFKGEV